MPSTRRIGASGRASPSSVTLAILPVGDFSARLLSEGSYPLPNGRRLAYSGRLITPGRRRVLVEGGRAEVRRDGSWGGQGLRPQERIIGSGGRNRRALGAPTCGLCFCRSSALCACVTGSSSR